MVKRSQTRKRKKAATAKLSDLNYVKEGNFYEQAVYNVIYNVVTNYANQGKLEKGYTRDRVDAILSKYVDEPRNIDGIVRAKKWTEYLLDNKLYAKGDHTFKKSIFQLKHISLI